MRLPKSGSDARKIREATGLSQQNFADHFGWHREQIARTEGRDKLTLVERWFYWYVKKFGIPTEEQKGDKEA